MKRLAKRLTAAVLLAAVCLTATVYSRTKPVELRLGFMAGSYWDAPSGNCYAVIDAAIERFEREHPNVRVTYTSGILKRDYSEWLIDQYLLGSEPDVFLVLPEDFGTLCELGALAPLDGCLAQDKEVSDTDFYPAALQSGAENGVQYALPYECVPTLMCVNKTLLESEGITVPSGDWTWEDFYNICAKVTRDTDGDGENALAVAHAFLRTHVRPGAFALDATAGNGHDTLFLCRLVGAAGRVLAFDVQP